MKVLNQLFKKTKSKDKNLLTAAVAIVGMENKLAEKEAEVVSIRKILEQLYQDAVLEKKDSKKINQIKVALEEKQAEIEGLKSVIEAAKTEAIFLAETEIEDILAAKNDLREQMKLETAEENTKILAAMQELLVAIYRVYGIRGAISKDATRFSISTSTMSDADLLKANQELEVLFNSMTTGPHIITEQIREIEKKIAKAEPNQLVEKALQDARPASPQNDSKKAA